MEFGVYVPHQRINGALTPAIETAKRAEALGFASVWTSDHVVSPARVHATYPHARPGTVFTAQSNADMLDPVVVLATLGAQTSTIRLGFGVLVVPYRPPLLLANQLASLDVVTNGRVIAGIGAGWHTQEFEALGVPYSERRGRFDEAITIWRQVWTGENVAFAGKYTQFDALKVLPPPLQPGGPPLWIGGDSRPARDRAARFGDGWMPAFASAERFAADSAEIRGQATEFGRPAPRGVLQRPLRIAFDGEAPPAVDADNPYRPTVGSVREIIATFESYQRAGVETILLHLSPDLERRARELEVVAAEIMPAFR